MLPPTQPEDDDLPENLSDCDATQPIQKKKNFLQGTLTKISANASLTTLTIRLTERVTPKKEEQEEHVPSQSTSSKPLMVNGTPKRRLEHDLAEASEDHLIILHGSWCQFLAQDLKITLNLKVYVDCYSPEYDLRRNSWEFMDGLRADLFIHNPAYHPLRAPLEPKLFRKKIDFGPTPPDELNEIQLDEYVEEEKDDLATFQQKISQSNPIKHSIKHEQLLEEEEIVTKKSATPPNPHKRICTDPNPDPTADGLPDAGLRNQILHSFNPQPFANPSPNSNSDQARRAASTFPSTLNNNFDGRSTPYATKSSKKSQVWKTLDEIDKMVGGLGEKFNTIGIIKSKQTDTSERALGGTLDYKMTLYLTDFSRPIGYRDVTCNLFSKSEREAPPWLSADWAIIILFNVYKRRSDIYSTQIVGPASSFDWAVWCPGYIGSAERLETSYSKKNGNNDPTFSFQDQFNVTEAELKRMACELYESYRRDCDSSESQPQSLADFDSSVTSIPKNISELHHGIRHKVDLCVKIIDVWIDSPGNDRLTVTDYTPNPLFKLAKPPALMGDNSEMLAGPITPIVKFHFTNGGTHESSWKATEKRIMSLYVAQPILEVLYHKLQEHDKSDRSQRHYPFDVKESLVDKFFKFKQVDIRVRAGSSNNGIIYGILENPFKAEGNAGQVEDLDDQTFDMLASRIVQLKPSDPPYRRMLDAQIVYQVELKPQHS